MRQFTGLTLANLIVACTSFITLVVVARTLPVDEFARLVFAQSVAAAAFAVFDPRVEDALIRFVPKVERSHGGAAASRLFERMLLVDQGANLMFGVLALVLLLVVPVPEGSIADPVLLSLAVIQIAIQGSIGTMTAGFALTDGLARWGLLQSITMIVFAAGSLAGLAIGDAAGFLAGGALSAVITTSALWLKTVHTTRRAYGAPAQEALPLPMGFIAFTVRAAANSSVSIGAEAIPLTVIGLRSSASTLAGFRIALSPARLASAVVSPVASIIYPRASRASAARHSSTAAEEALRYTRQVVPIAGVVLFVSAIAMPTAITLVFGQPYRGYGTTATILLSASLIRGTVAWSKTLPLAFGHATRRLVTSIVDGAALIGAAALLSDTDYAVGVAIAYLGVAVVISIYWLRYAHRQTKRDLSLAGAGTAAASETAPPAKRRWSS
jgi:O-antigen/teichoic acid export membrane protein